MGISVSMVLDFFCSWIVFSKSGSKILSYFKEQSFWTPFPFAGICLDSTNPAFSSNNILVVQVDCGISNATHNCDMFIDCLCRSTSISLRIGESSARAITAISENEEKQSGWLMRKRYHVQWIQTRELSRAYVSFPNHLHYLVYNSNKDYGLMINTKIT
jgi:hypothetical protein